MFSARIKYPGRLAMFSITPILYFFQSCQMANFQNSFRYQEHHKVKLSEGKQKMCKKIV